MKGTGLDGPGVRRAHHAPKVTPHPRRDGDKRMSKIEMLLYGVIIAVLFGPGVAADFVKKLLGL